MSDATSQCPVCRATIAAGSEKCWLCFQAIPHAASAEAADDLIYAEPVKTVVDASNPFSPPATILDEAYTGWSTLTLVVVLILVSGGLAVAAPGLGIPLAVMITPTLIRSVIHIKRRQKAGEQLTQMETAGVFFASLAAVVTAATAAGVAFLVTCVATCFGFMALNDGPRQLPEAFLFVPPILIGLFTGGLVLYLFWNRRSPRR